MTTETLLSLLQVGLTVAAAVWAVARVHSATQVLAQQIDTLRQSVDSLRATLLEVQSSVNRHETDIAVIKTRMELESIG